MCLRSEIKSFLKLLVFILFFLIHFSVFNTAIALKELDFLINTDEPGAKVRTQISPVKGFRVRNDRQALENFDNLNHQDQKIRRSSARRLYNQFAFQVFVPYFAEALTNDDVSVRRFISAALYEIGQGSYIAAPALIKSLSDKDLSVRSNALAALGEIGPIVSNAIPKIKFFLDDDSYKLRAGATIVLGKMGRKANVAIPSIAKLLKDKVLIVREKACGALGSIGPDAYIALPNLHDLFNEGLIDDKVNVAKSVERIAEALLDADGVYGLKDLEQFLTILKKNDNADIQKSTSTVQRAVKYLSSLNVKPNQEEKFSFSLEIPIPPNTKIVRAFIDSQALSPNDFDYFGGKIHLSSAGEFFFKLSDGAHHLRVELNKLKDPARRIYEERFLFWKELSELELYYDKEPKKYAVIIGIGEYKINDPGLNDLPDAPKQAKALGQLLESRGFNVKYFLDTEDDKLTITREVINNYLFKDLNPKLNKQEDQLLLYFGGHGASIIDVFDEKSGYFLPGEYDRKNLELTGISMVIDVRQRYVQFLRAKHILIAVDACLADVGLRGVRPSKNELKEFKGLADLKAKTERPGRTILTAGTDGQDAIDVNGGIFTKALIEALRGDADVNRDGLIDINELDTYIHRNVSSKAQSLGYSQTPGRFNIPPNGGEFVHFYRSDWLHD